MLETKQKTTLKKKMKPRINGVTLLKGIFLVSESILLQGLKESMLLLNQF